MSLAITGLSVIAAPPASALTTNLIATNEGGDPLDTDTVTITTNENLWAYITTTTGAIVCVDDPAHIDAEHPCESESSWGVTASGPFFAGPIPVATHLRRGTWVLVAEKPLGFFGTGGVDKVSEPFTVVPCETDCDTPPDPTLAKQAFNQIYESIHTTCDMAEELETAHDLQDLETATYEMMVAEPPGASVGMLVDKVVEKATGMVVDSFKPSKVPYLPSAIGYGVWAMCKSLFGTTFPSYPIPTLEGPSTELPGPLAGIAQWLHDPPQPYDAVATANPIDWTKFDLSRFDAGALDVAKPIDALRAYLVAGTTAWERLQAARTDGAVSAEHAQADAVDTNFTHLRSAMYDLAGGAENVLNAISTDATFDQTVTQADIDLAHPFLQRVRDSGFTAAEVDQLRAAGIGDAGIIDLQDQLAAGAGDVTAGATLSGALTSLQQALLDGVDAVDDFARQGAGFADAVDQPPVASFTVTPTFGNVPLEVTATDTSTSPDGDPIASVSWDFGDSGTATGGTAVHTYVTGNVFTITETVCDPGDHCATATHTVHAVDGGGGNNHSPVAGSGSVTTDQDKPASVHVMELASDPDGDPLTLTGWTQGAHGAVDCSVTFGTCTYTPDTGYVGEDSFNYTVSDGIADATGSISVTVVEAINGDHRPVASDDAYSGTKAIAFDPLVNDTDPDTGDLLTVAGTTSPEHGTVSCQASGGCLYTADPGYVGPDGFDYHVADPAGVANTAHVTLDIQAPQSTGNDFFAVDDHLTTSPGTTRAVDVLANDVSPGTVTVTAHTTPKHGSVACTTAGSCSYKPANGFSGYDGFRYSATDNAAQTSQASVLVTVAPAGAGFSVVAGGHPSDPAHASGTTITQGDGASWTAGAWPTPGGVDDAVTAALAAPTVDATLTGPHSLTAAPVVTAPGWTAAVQTGPTVELKAGGAALLGNARTDALPAPAPPIAQGTGGDGFVPIVVGHRVYATFHHSFPTAVSCVDEATGQRCPGYPHQIPEFTSNWVGPAAVIGTRFYVHLSASDHYAHQAPISLYCWDTATDATCGLITVDNVFTDVNLGGSAPVLVNGKIYFAAQTGKLYCVDPATNAPCTTPPIATHLDNDLNVTPASFNEEYTLITHGSRVYVTNDVTRVVACLDVAAGAACADWATPRAFSNGGFWLFSRHDASGAPSAVCVASPSATSILACTPYTGPMAESDFDTFHGSNLIAPMEVAETGTRTWYVAHFESPGLSCWDWATMAPCTGGDLVDGTLSVDANSNALPHFTYGATFDGSCVIALGDPGQVFTVDPAGFSPCTTLGHVATHTVDLRTQRCDGTVGAAHWNALSVKEAVLTPGTELASLAVVVRDATTGAVLASKEMVGSDGVLDLSGIDPVKHPALSYDATVRSVAGDPAWADGDPPRLQLSWTPDPAAGCFGTTTTVNCSAASPSQIGINATLVGAATTATPRLGLVAPPTCGVNAATLTVNVTVINDNGGGAGPGDFAVSLDDTPFDTGVPTGVAPGVHVVDVTDVPGYAITIDGDCDTDGNITLASADAKTCTVTADDLGVATGLLGRKLDVLRSLQDMLAPATKPAREHLKTAIHELAESVESKYWETDSRLTDKGEYVIHEERDAVHALMDIKQPSAGVTSAIQALYDIDQTLASSEVSRAMVAAPPATAKDKGIHHELDEAIRELAKASVLAGSQQWDDAIEHFVHAWQHARHAWKEEHSA